ncbi:MAG: hypothetical protein ACE5E1_07085 [Phycisphaerae bacterium]
MVELTVQRGTDEVEAAIVQFAARRSYRLSKPWWIEGLRIEPKPTVQRHIRRGGPLGSFIAGLFDVAQAPRIEVVLKRRRGRTRLKIDVSNHVESIQLAYELHAYLQDDRSYDCKCPPICPRCGNPVPNATARYCGRCGHAMLPADRESSAKATASVPPARSAAPEPALPVAELREAVSVERDDAAARAAESPAPAASRDAVRQAGSVEEKDDHPPQLAAAVDDNDDDDQRVDEAAVRLDAVSTAAPTDPVHANPDEANTPPLVEDTAFPAAAGAAPLAEAEAEADPVAGETEEAADGGAREVESPEEIGEPDVPEALAPPRRALAEE